MACKIILKNVQKTKGGKAPEGVSRRISDNSKC